MGFFLDNGVCRCIYPKKDKEGDFFLGWNSLSQRHRVQSTEYRVQSTECRVQSTDTQRWHGMPFWEMAMTKRKCSGVRGVL